MANDEEINAFEFDNYIFRYDVNLKKWKNEEGDVLSVYCNVEECLNDEVEIIEEDNGEEDNGIEYLHFHDLTEPTENEKILISKFNEIIDYINELKDNS